MGPIVDDLRSRDPGQHRRPRLDLRMQDRSGRPRRQEDRSEDVDDRSRLWHGKCLASRCGAKVETVAGSERCVSGGRLRSSLASGLDVGSGEIATGVGSRSAAGFRRSYLSMRLGQSHLRLLFATQLHAAQGAMETLSRCSSSQRRDQTPE